MKKKLTVINHYKWHCFWRQRWRWQRWLWWWR